MNRSAGGSLRNALGKVIQLHLFRDSPGLVYDNHANWEEERRRQGWVELSIRISDASGVKD